MANPSAILEAKESFHTTDDDGKLVSVSAGFTRIRADHELAKRFPQHFRPVEEGLSFGLEEATDNPGDVREREVIHRAPEPPQTQSEPEAKAEAPKPSTGSKPAPARTAPPKSTTSK